MRYSRFKQRFTWPAIGSARPSKLRRVSLSPSGCSITRWIAAGMRSPSIHDAADDEIGRQLDGSRRRPPMISGDRSNSTLAAHTHRQPDTSLLEPRIRQRRDDVVKRRKAMIGSGAMQDRVILRMRVRPSDEPVENIGIKEARDVDRGVR
jgi:hypothetical protein